MLVLFQIGSLPPKDLGKHNKQFHEFISMALILLPDSGKVVKSPLKKHQATLALQSRLKIIESPT